MHEKEIKIERYRMKNQTVQYGETVYDDIMAYVKE